MKTRSKLRNLLFNCAAFTLFATVVAPAGFSQEKNPFAGAWQANISKSKRHPNHLFKSAVMRFEVSADVVSLTYTGVNMSGVEESGTSKLYPDGKEHPITEAPGFVALSRWLGPRILETTARKDGKVVGHSTYEISEDGKTLTANITGIDASGSTFEQVIVFDRVA
jgi:hypothetical protein